MRNCEDEVKSVCSTITIESSDSSLESKTGPERPPPVCETTEVELLTINWQQGKTLSEALKSMSRFMVSIDVTEVVELEGTDGVLFRMAEKKKFVKSLKIYSR